MASRTRKKSPHNLGHKPFYKDHRGGDFERSCERCGTPIRFGAKRCRSCYECGSDFLKSDAAKALKRDEIERLSEPVCEAIFEQVRWKDGIPVCPDCDSCDLYHLQARNRWRCKNCGDDFTSTTGTPFASHKKPFKTILLAIASLNECDHPTAKELQRQLGYTVKAAGALRHRVSGHLTYKGLIAARKNAFGHQFALGVPRYRDGGEWNTRMWWTQPERDALASFIAKKASPEQVALALGRSSSSLRNYAKDMPGIILPDSWKTYVRKIRAGREPDLQYPYIIVKRDEHSDLLRINAIIPRNLPSEMRADICQEAMLAVLEGKVTIEELEQHKDKRRWFVSKFYKNNFEDSGHAVPTTAVNFDGEEYDNVARNIAWDHWREDQARELRHSYSAFGATFYEPTQIEDTYESQIKMEQGRNHNKGLLLSFGEAAESLARSGKSANQVGGHHATQRLIERYGFRPEPGLLRDAVRAVKEGRVSVIQRDGEKEIGWIRLRGKRVLVVSDGRGVLTVLPPDAYQQRA